MKTMKMKMTGKIWMKRKKNYNPAFIYHLQLVGVLNRVVSMSEEKERIFFKKEVRHIITHHIKHMVDWITTSNRILTKLNKIDEEITADAHADDIGFCNLAIDIWERTYDFIGLGYNKIFTRYKKLAPIEKKQIFEEDLNMHKEKIVKLVAKTNLLAKKWQKRLSRYPHHKQTATDLNWLANLTVEEFIP